MRWTPLVFLCACLPATNTPDRGCPEIEADFDAELAAVQSCAEDAECGQVLVGTSCGCTRDLVARLDADTTALYALIDEGQGCALPLTSVCDCPSAEGYVCADGVCAWSYVTD